MKLEFERKDGLSCVEFIYKGVAGNLALEYELAFLEAWSFGFDKENHTAFSNEGNRENNLVKFHGLKVINHYPSQGEDISLFIKATIEQYGMCMILTDLYDIPWSATCYQKRHWTHAILITDIIATGYYCYDFYAMEGIVLPTDKLVTVYKIVTFQATTIAAPVNDFKSFRGLLIETLNKKIECCNAFGSMESFADDIRNCLDIHEIAKDADSFENSKFINSVNRVAQCRFQFASVLEYANQKYPEAHFEECISLLKKCAVSWKSITALLIKAYLVKDTKRVLQKVANKVLEAKQLEEYVYSELKKHLHNQNCGKIAKTNTVHTAIIYHHYDLSAVFNHKAFGDHNNSQKACYEHRSFIMIDDSLQKRYLVAGDLSFRLGEVETATYDNVECCGQKLSIDRNCSAIMILANAEFDHQIDKMGIESEEGYSEIEIATSSWQCTPILGDQVLWSGTGAVQYANDIVKESGKKHLFGKKYLLPHSVYINNINLPDNPNFHIYALTLCE